MDPGLRELNELNFARFDAKMERRLAEFYSHLEHHMSMVEVSSTETVRATKLRIDRRMGDMTRMMIGMWVTIVVGAAALWFKL